MFDDECFSFTLTSYHHQEVVRLIKVIIGLMLLLYSTTSKSGYENNYKANFVVRDPALTCMECDQYALKPRQILCPSCHIVCQDCMDEYKKKYHAMDKYFQCKRCMETVITYKQAVSEKTEDEINPGFYLFSSGQPEWFREAINKSYVRCDYFENSCSWLNAFEKYADHVNACKFKYQSCSKCDQKYIERMKALHDLSHSHELECEFCGEKINSAKYDKHIRFICSGKKNNDEQRVVAGASERGRVSADYHSFFTSQAVIKEHFMSNSANKRKRENFISTPQKGMEPGCKKCYKPALRSFRGGLLRTSKSFQVLCPWCQDKTIGPKIDVPENSYQLSVLIRVAGNKKVAGEDFTVVNGELEFDRGIYYWTIDSDDVNKKSITLNDIFGGKIILTITSDLVFKEKIYLKSDFIPSAGARMQKCLILAANSKVLNSFVFPVNELRSVSKTIPLYALYGSIMIIPLSDKGEIKKTPCHDDQSREVIEWRVENLSQHLLVLENLEYKGDIESRLLESDIFESGGNHMRLGFQNGKDWLDFYIDYVPIEESAVVNATLFSVVIKYAGESWQLFHQNLNGKGVTLNSGAVSWLVLRDLMKAGFSDDTLLVSVYPLISKTSFSDEKLIWELYPIKYIQPVDITQPNICNLRYLYSHITYKGELFELRACYNAHTKTLSERAWHWKARKGDDRVLKFVERGDVVPPGEGRVTFSTSGWPVKDQFLIIVLKIREFKLTQQIDQTADTFDNNKKKSDAAAISPDGRHSADSRAAGWRSFFSKLFELPSMNVPGTKRSTLDIPLANKKKPALERPEQEEARI
ncbi:hypothetical protein M3P05_08290 [Sansalvadorimonas sp. 2012CJ34-2]|uniref:Uncharacterized protein n=1 Tax=Parendozoicomonas callyspongiae TaxID=2942213 RepID=A0ABT0PF41_9GAMM|nr:hypothetical protein [Sansalvadorimonas sp. 2012CJ34-2]MCL6269935.1 hypothetical protein [Sansalvadorimonas sp. 2012CJ34-2]